MDIVQIVFISAVIFPIIAAIAVMLFVRSLLSKMRKRKSDFEAKEKNHKMVINSLEKVVETQDTVLEAYRDVHTN